MPNQPYISWPIYPLLAACSTLPLHAQSLQAPAIPHLYSQVSSGQTLSAAPYSAAEYVSERTPLGILEGFAYHLVRESLETPQAALDAVDEHFWKLI